MEPTLVDRGYIRIMEKKMEPTIVYRSCMGMKMKIGTWNCRTCPV